MTFVLLLAFRANVLAAPSNEAILYVDNARQALTGLENMIKLRAKFDADQSYKDKHRDLVSYIE